MQSFIKIGDLIHHYRIEKGLTQEELAEGICSREYIYQLETHKKIPTLYMINLLSERMGTNLYDSYATMFRHNGIETHKKIVLINQALASADFNRLDLLVSQYKDLPDFQTGEPKMFLQYSECVYLSNVLYENHKAIDLAKSALGISSIDTIEHFFVNKHFSNIEFLLINFIAVNSCREKNYVEGKKYFDELYKHMDLLFKENHYISNRNNHFELRFFANLIYNDFCFFYDKGLFDTDKLDTILNLLKSLYSHFNLPELLLCRSCIYFKNNEVDLGNQYKKIAQTLGVYLYSQEIMEQLEQDILSLCR